MDDLNAGGARSVVAAYNASVAQPAAYSAEPGRESMSDRFTPFIVSTTTGGVEVPGFDWRNWQPYTDGRFMEPAFARNADADTLRKLITTHVRLERFVEGHLELMHERGVLPAAVTRLAQLADEGAI